MARVSRKDKGEWARALYLFHRECVRRNSEYQQDYRSWVGAGKPVLPMFGMIQEKWSLWEMELPDPGEKPDWDEVLRKLEFPRGRWDVINLPKHELMAYGTFENCFNCNQFSEKQRSNLKGHLFLVYFPEEKKFNWSETVAVFDINRPKDEIKASIIKKIDDWMMGRKVAGLTQKSVENKIHLEEALQYLKAYDLREKGMPYERIAEILKKRNKASSMDAREAKRYRANAEKYIENPPLLRYSERDYQEKVQRFFVGKVKDRKGK